jgi:hypothetical protein
VRGRSGLGYVAAIGIAAYSTQVTPVGAALRGASLMEIAEARGEFLAKREGVAVLLRYAAVILGRSVLPFLIAYAYWSEHRLRHVALIALLACYGVALEKASPSLLVPAAHPAPFSARVLARGSTACRWPGRLYCPIHLPGDGRALQSQTTEACE